jgi:hypothetical protein
MRSLLLAFGIASFAAIVSAQAQVPNFNDCRNYAGSRALTQDQRRHSFVTVWHAPSRLRAASSATAA